MVISRTLFVSGFQMVKMVKPDKKSGFRMVLTKWPPKQDGRQKIFG
jgi:hypothetical protein